MCCKAKERRMFRDVFHPSMLLIFNMSRFFFSLCPLCALFVPVRARFSHRSNRFPRDAMDDLPMPSAVSTSNYRRVSIGDGVPPEARRRRKATRSNKKKRRRGVVVSSSSSGESSDSDGSSDGSSGSSSGSDDSDDLLYSSSSEEEERSSLREVVLELPVMASSLREKGAKRWVSSV